MDLTTETLKVKGQGCSELTRKKGAFESERRARGSWDDTQTRPKNTKQRWVTSARENIFLFNILEDHGKKVTLPSWSLVANVITDGIGPG